MDRGLFYPAQLPQDTDFLSLAKQAMIGIAAVAEAAIGQDSASSSASGYASVSGLACSALSNTAVSGSAFAVQIGRGFIFSLQQTDPNAYGNLGTDTATSILKTGINLSSTNLGLTNAAPATAGQSINYLISAQFAETDTNSVAVPFYNSAAPASPLVVAENTNRTQRVVFQVTGGTAAATGSQTTPATPSGYVPLWVVTITNGQTAVASGNIVTAPGAPFISSLVGSAALYLKSANNLSDVASAATALGNLGGLKASNNLSDLGTLATALTNLGFGSDSAGYFKVPNPNNTAKPWIVQFATLTAPSGAWTFPVAFPNACKICVGNCNTSNSSYIDVLEMSAFTTTGATFSQSYAGGSTGSTNGTCYLVAIGN